MNAAWTSRRRLSPPLVFFSVSGQLISLLRSELNKCSWVILVSVRSKIAIFTEIQRVGYFCLALMIFPNFSINRKCKFILSNANHKAVNRRLRFTHEILHHQINFHAFQMGKLLTFRFGESGISWFCQNLVRWSISLIFFSLAGVSQTSFCHQISNAGKF